MFIVFKLLYEKIVLMFQQGFVEISKNLRYRSENNSVGTIIII